MLKERQDLLEAIWAEDFDPATAHPFVARIREIALSSNSSGALEYLINQRIGSPKTRIESVLDGANFVRYLAEAMHSLGYTKEQAKDLIAAVHERIPTSED